jgi:hypothetical protein
MDEERRHEMLGFGLEVVGFVVLIRVYPCSSVAKELTGSKRGSSDIWIKPRTRGMATDEHG